MTLKYFYVAVKCSRTIKKYNLPVVSLVHAQLGKGPQLGVHGAGERRVQAHRVHVELEDGALGNEAK